MKVFQNAWHKAWEAVASCALSVAAAIATNRVESMISRGVQPIGIPNVEHIDDIVMCTEVAFENEGYTWAHKNAAQFVELLAGGAIARDTLKSHGVHLRSVYFASKHVLGGVAHGFLNEGTVNLVPEKIRWGDL